MTQSKRDVYSDHTAEPASLDSNPPGPPSADEPDFEPSHRPRSPGFSNTPGAGPNPTAADSV